ncbi:DDE superfamily endonuclease-domain-containing protein [Mycena maculata]|uniref:DDE superfamily endonuclease-domain-containing protein n=1 Tax=Mycena maculata TaxID=230809 RepID=A0AAD7JKI7_9AGAR|nr:DDE superfamily endonuclease-domain-containing protein [Mycena maculata]
MPARAPDPPNDHTDATAPTQRPESPVDTDDDDFENMPKEKHIQLAIAAIQANIISERKAAIYYRVPRTTVQRRATGILTRVEAHVHRRSLSQAQEDVLAEWVKSLGKRGIPLSLPTIGSYAAEIYGAPLGVTWPVRFKKHRPDLKVKNIWNMDEKGIQLGVGDRIRALVDRDQKVVQKIESGNRDLVTIIKCIAADGTALHPSVVFQGLRRDLRWGEDNPCDASISISPNGWTDQELGALWLEKDFTPASAERLDEPGDYRLLILDGHNSHCTHRFIDFAQKHRIIILCLPSHTTHALQPCDVGVFSPLAAKWKARVSQFFEPIQFILYFNTLFLNQCFISSPIHFHQFLGHVASFHHDQLLIREPVPTAAEALQARDALHAAYTVAMPSPVCKTASRQALASENEQLRNLLKVAGIDLDKNYVQMVLMERENGNMRQQLYANKNKPKRTYTTGKARLMTSAEMQQALLDELHKKQMTGLHSEMKKKWFPAIRKEIAEAEKVEKAAAKKREQEVKAATKAAEKEAKAVEKAAAKAKKAAEKEAAKAAKAAAKGRGHGQGGAHDGRRGGVRGPRVVRGVGRGRGKVQESEDEEESSPETDSSDEESDLDEQVVGTNPGPNATNDESSNEETDFDEPAVTTKPGPGALSVMQDESVIYRAGVDPKKSDDNDESEQEETEIGRFNGHRWEARCNLQFQVVWTDGDVTWEPLSSVNDCAAMEDYLAHRDVDDPLLLSKRKFLINTTLRASNE